MPVFGKKTIILLASLATTSLLTGCVTTRDAYTDQEKTSRTTQGAVIGGVIGALGGAIAKDDDRGKGALIGAAAGAAVGGGIGYYMDQQEAQLRARLRNSGVSVTRIGDDIILNMPGNVTFATDNYNINSGFYDVLNAVALVLNEFDQTLIEVAGHTDSTGADSYNLQLSQRRAQSVTNYLIAQNVAAGRFQVIGFGERQPIASNATSQGRAQNRRVEIRIQPIARR